MTEPRFDGQRVLVTGGAGFIGSHITDALVRAGARVRVLDDLSSGFRENLADVAGDVELVEGSILDEDTVTAAVRGVDAICHQAAQLEIIRCIEEPLEDLRSNAEGTLRVLEAARVCGVRRVVWASSACVYGQAQAELQPESHPTSPNWPYGVSKLAAEHYARLYHELHGVSTTALRYSIVYGPREWYGRVLTAFLRRALDGQPPVIWGGRQQRDFVHVSDVVAANLALLADQRFEGSRVFNVSTGRGTRIRDLAALVCEAFELAPPIFEDVAEGEASELVDGRVRLPAELAHMVLDPAALHQAIGWQAKIALPDGLLSETAWLREHADRWSVMHY